LALRGRGATRLNHLDTKLELCY